MSDSIAHSEKVISDLEACEETARSAAAGAEGTALSEELEALADSLARDRQNLEALLDALRQHRGDPNRDEELTDHGDRNDPESDLGL